MGWLEGMGEMTGLNQSFARNGVGSGGWRMLLHILFICTKTISSSNKCTECLS